MILGILPPLGSSLFDMEIHGQKERFLKYYLFPYAKEFEKVRFFSYLNEAEENLTSKIELIVPKRKVHRYLYGILLPILHNKEFSQCSVFRCFHISSTLPAIIGKLFFQKKFIFNYNYDYKQWAKIEGKSYLIPFISILEKVAFRLSDGIFVSDQSMNDYVGSQVQKSKVHLIPNGVDTQLFKPSKSTPNGKTVKILSIGRLEKQKNFPLLLQAISLLNFPVNMTIVGQGSEQETLQQLAKKLNIDLEIIPKVPHLQLPNIYTSAHIYIQTSLMEAPVKTLLEAMSCARPVIGTKVPGIENVIQDGIDGYLVDSSAEVLADRITKLVNDPALCQKFGAAARKKVITSYNLPNIVAKEIVLLKKV